MTICKLVAAVSAAVLLFGAAIALRSYLTARPDAVIFWQPLLAFSLPAVVLVFLLLLNFKLTGIRYQRLMLAAVGALAVLSLPVPDILCGNYLYEHLLVVAVCSHE